LTPDFITWVAQLSAGGWWLKPTIRTSQSRKSGYRPR